MCISFSDLTWIQRSGWRGELEKIFRPVSYALARAISCALFCLSSDKVSDMFYLHDQWSTSPRMSSRLSVWIFTHHLQCAILRRVRVADRGFRSAGYAGISPLRDHRPHWFFSGKISWAAPRFRPGVPATVPVYEWLLVVWYWKRMRGRELGLFPGNKLGQAVNAVATQQSNLLEPFSRPSLAYMCTKVD